MDSSINVDPNHPQFQWYSFEDKQIEEVKITPPTFDETSQRTVLTPKLENFVRKIAVDNVIQGISHDWNRGKSSEVTSPSIDNSLPKQLTNLIPELQSNWKSGDLDELEDKEREYRSQRQLSPVLLGKLARMHNQLLTHSFSFPRKGSRRTLSYSFKPKGRKNKEWKQKKINVKSVPSQKALFVSSRTPADLLDAIENERQSRMKKGVNPVLLGKLHLVNRQFAQNNFSWPKTSVGFAFNNNVSGNYYRMKSRKLGSYSSQFANKYSFPLRCPSDIRYLEEGERQERMSKGTDPVMLGRLNILHTELKKANFELPKKSLRGSFKIRQNPRFPGNNWYGREVSFRWPRRIPSEIREMEEKERQDRIEMGSNPQIIGMLKEVHKELLASQRSVWMHPIEAAQGLVEGTIHATESAIGGVLGLMSSLVHSAQDKLGMSDPSSVTSIHKVEEQARLEKMNEKVDPIISSRKARTQDELTHSIKMAN